MQTFIHPYFHSHPCVDPSNLPKDLISWCIDNMGTTTAQYRNGDQDITIIANASGIVISQNCQNNKVYHCEDGPALSVWYPSGAIKEIEYIVNGYRRSYPEPYRVRFYEDGAVCEKHYMNNPNRDAPSTISYYPNGAIQSATYNWRGDWGTVGNSDGVVEESYYSDGQPKCVEYAYPQSQKSPLKIRRKKWHPNGMLKSIDYFDEEDFPAYVPSYTEWDDMGNTLIQAWDHLVNSNNMQFPVEREYNKNGEIIREVYKIFGVTITDEIKEWAKNETIDLGNMLPWQEDLFRTTFDPYYHVEDHTFGNHMDEFSCGCC